MAEVQKTTLSGELTQRFIEFVVMHAQNAALFLGQIPNPKTGQGEVNLDLARMFIDQLAMIQEKTRGNLTSEEAKVLTQRAFQFADGICGSCAGTAYRRYAARGARSRAVTKTGGAIIDGYARAISAD